MRSFDEIFAIAADRHGGPQALETKLARPLSGAELEQIPADRWLAQMTRSIFQAGFSWKVIEQKWPGFEAAFEGFDIGRCAMMDDDWFDRLVADDQIVRNGKKIATVRENAVFLSGLSDQGGAGKVLGLWPSTDFIGLMDLLKTRASHMGGTSAQYAMRMMGRDAFVLSTDVTQRLIVEGVIDKPATSRTALRAVQGAFNTWMDQSGRSLSEISGTLARSL
ncbi:DNA-3-methyladenine glycosylase I [Chachezhania sediminis]|uniref:DNA-3-methyladenine glycosylase I n=1 Tax=Chachezhania sediminis TaxID=2599291 RepID=UPI00131C1BDC|nr:DNA-3-methyladenine glycosylase I [Chachezhania sediminis]